MNTLPEHYDILLESLKTRIRQAQVKAALAVNHELVLLYWHIGKDILTRQAQEGWGARVIDRLSNDLRRSFPDMKGLSSRNLKYMRSFSEAYQEEQIVQQAAAQIPEYAGKINFSLAALDDLVKHPDDQPSIEIILCRSKGNAKVHYAFQRIASPIGVSTHQLPKELEESLPTI